MTESEDLPSKRATPSKRAAPRRRGSRSRGRVPGFRSFLETACLLGAAILIWLTILGTVVVLILTAFALMGFEEVAPWWDDDEPAIHTDPLGRECPENFVTPEGYCP